MNVDQNTTVIAGSVTDPASKIEQLLADGKTKQAVELAKEQHKKLKTAQTESLLVRAYIARIEQFRGKGMAEEAQTLLSLVWDRFPTQRAQVAPLRMSGAIAEGRIGELVAPLADPALPAEQRQLIDDLLRRQLTDPSALASAATLPAAQRLRLAAAAVAKAFEAVTAGPVGEEQLALPEVSRRSPLASWKLLIRAIAAFYRRDDDACRRALDGIEPDSAVTPLAAAIRAMVDRVPTAGGAAGALQVRVASTIGPLTAALSAIERACRDEDESLLKRSIREAIQHCTAARPDFVVRLKQLISVTCYAHATTLDTVLAAMGPSLKDAFFWRQLALAAEKTMAPVEAGSYWERFWRHSVAEGAFAEASPEAGAVWLRVAEQLAQVPEHSFTRIRDQLTQYDVIVGYYDRQPIEIAALRPKSSEEYADRVLDPDKAFAQAARIAPNRRAFHQWWVWANKSRKTPKACEDIAQRWSAALPSDIEPMLILADLAEQRNALSMALKRIARAEAIDPASAQVREARVRLMLAIAWRHFDHDKLNLLDADLRDLALLPGVRDTDGEAVVSFMAAARRVKLGDRAGAIERVEAGMRRLGPMVGWTALRSVAEKTGAMKIDPMIVPAAPTGFPPVDIARAMANITRLATALEMKMYLPVNWDAAVSTVLSQPNCPLTCTDLWWIGKSAWVRDDYEQLYRASSAGLAQARVPADSARFLLLRAQSLQEPWASVRVKQCLRAALELAKTAHDEKLLEQVLAEIDQTPDAAGMFGNRRTRPGPTPVNAEEVLHHERLAPQRPANRAEANAHLIPSLAEKSNANQDYSYDDQPFLWGTDDDDDDDFDEDDEDDQGEVDLGDLPDFGGALPALFLKFLKSRGMTIEQALANPRVMLDLFADPTKGITPEQLEAMQKELQAFDPFGDGAPKSPGPRRTGRTKRRRK